MINDKFNPELLYCIGDDSYDSAFSVIGKNYAVACPIVTNF